MSRDGGRILANATDEISKLKEITDKLEQGIVDLFESEKYMEYLRTMSRFYNYSFNNTLLIAMQKPDATLIAGYNSWQKNFERHVLKGEKGIRIIAPAPYKKKEVMEKIDQNTQRPVLDPMGKPVVEEVEITIPAFRVVPVFDVSQTEGKEISDLVINELMGTVENYSIFMQALSEVSPAPIEFELIEGGAKGYYRLIDKSIAIQKDMSEIQTLKTTIHEIAHAKLHDVESNRAIGVEVISKGRRTMEVEAESVAYTVCQHYGIETSDYSFGYVAGWSSGKGLGELKSSLELIRNTASELINSIDEQVELIQKLQIEEVKKEPLSPMQKAEKLIDLMEKEKPQFSGDEKDLMMNYAFQLGDIDKVTLLADQLAEQGYGLEYGFANPDIVKQVNLEVDLVQNQRDENIINQEALLLNEAEDYFAIYQLKDIPETREFRFESMEYMHNLRFSIDKKNYDFIYSAHLSEEMTLGEIFQTFYLNRPEDFKGHSLSMSDVIVLQKNGERTAHYIDKLGFEEIPHFFIKEHEKVLSNNEVGSDHSNYSISFYTAECMEFPNYGEYHDHLSLDEAVKIYEAMPSNRLNAGKGIGFILHNAVEARPGLEDASFELYSGRKIDVDIINSIPEFKNNVLVQQAILDIEKYFPGCVVQEKIMDNKFVQEEAIIKEPMVTVIWSESPFLKEGVVYPISEANKLFGELDNRQRADREKKDYDGLSYHKTKFQIEYVVEGKIYKYGGRQDFGDGDGNLIEHIRGSAEFYLKNKEYQKYLKSSNENDYERTTKHYENIIDVYVPYLRMHCNLTEIEQNIKLSISISNDGRMDYYEAMQEYVADSREKLNTNYGEIKLLDPPKMEDYIRDNTVEKAHEFSEGNDNIFGAIVTHDKSKNVGDLQHKKVSIKDQLSMNKERIEKKQEAFMRMKENGKNKEMRIE